MHNACTCKGKEGLAGSAAAVSLRGENSKSFAVTIFLTASLPSALNRLREDDGRADRSGNLLA